MRRFFRATTVLLTALCALVACTLFSDTKIYTDSKCSPPCWNGVTPGVADAAQVKTALQNLPVVNQRDPHNYETPQPPDGFAFHRVLVDGGDLAIRLKNDQVVSVYLADKSGETANDVIRQVGPPEYVYAEYQGAENIQLLIFLLYPSKGAYYLVVDKPQTSPLSREDRIESTMVVSEAAFVTPGTIQSMFDALGQKEGLGQCITARAQPWPGFGPIKVRPITTPC